MTCEEDFVQMRADATKKLEAEVKVYVIKNKVQFLYFSISPFSPMIVWIARDDELKVGSKDKETYPHSKKKKVRSICLHHLVYCPTSPLQNLPSHVEELQAELIQELEHCHHCKDHCCGMTPCYVNGPDAEHIHLTHMHLHTWAAAIVVSISILSFVLDYPDALLL